jgi:hypothetical protein
MSILNRFLIEDSQQVAQILSILQPIQDNLEQYNTEQAQTTHNSTSQESSEVGLQIPEIEMEMEEQAKGNSTTTEETQIPEITMGEQQPAEKDSDINTSISTPSLDIKMIPDYATRNRHYQPTNPFHICGKGSYTAGVMTANTPGDSKLEQIKYLANMLKLSEDKQHLIQYLFFNGNG